MGLFVGLKTFYCYYLFLFLFLNVSGHEAINQIWPVTSHKNLDDVQAQNMEI